MSTESSLSPRWDSDETPWKVGDRVVTRSKLTLPEGFEGYEPHLINQPGEVLAVEVYYVVIENDSKLPPIKVSTCRVRLDKFPDTPQIFHPDELEAQVA